MSNSILPYIADFLESKLVLMLHPKKVQLATFSSGNDFLGWIHFSDHRILRTTAKRKMFRVIMEKNSKEETLQLYLGLPEHGNAQKLQQVVIKDIFGHIH